MSRVIEKNPYYYFMGFPCHILHNNAHVGSIAFNVIMLVLLFSTLKSTAKSKIFVSKAFIILVKVKNISVYNTSTFLYMTRSTLLYLTEGGNAVKSLLLTKFHHPFHFIRHHFYKCLT